MKSLRSIRPLVLAITASLILAACGGGDDDAEPEAGSELQAISPLTGEPREGDAPDHPVMVVKIDNTTSSQPQLGLSGADMVIQEMVEGGITRLAVLFHSQLPEVVGPVRSARATDIGIVKPTAGVLVASGAAPPTYRRLDRADVQYFGEGAPGYFRASDRRAPYNLMMDLPKLADTIKRDTQPESSYLPFGEEADFAGVQEVDSMSVHYPSATTNWVWDEASGTWRNENSHAGRGDRFQPKTVLVLRVQQRDAGYRDPAGNPVPETMFYGSGPMMLFHGGQLLRGTWSKDLLESQLVLSTTAGEITVPPGKVWIELLPTQANDGRVTVQGPPAAEETPTQ